MELEYIRNEGAFRQKQNLTGTPLCCYNGKYKYEGMVGPLFKQLSLNYSQAPQSAEIVSQSHYSRPDPANPQKLCHRATIPAAAPPIG